MSSLGKKNSTELFNLIKNQAYNVNKITKINLLIKARADLNIQDENGNTALILAIQRNYIDIVKLLIEEGANLNIVNSNNVTALIYAVIKNKIDIVELLIKAGADLNIQDNNRSTALKYTIMFNEINIAKLLIENGADLNIQDDRDRTALIEAVAINRIDIAKLLIEAKADLNIQDNNGSTALIEAVIKNKIDIVELLIKAGADLNIQYNNGSTALMIAKKKKYEEIIELLRIKHSDLTYNKLLTITDFDKLISELMYPINFPTMIDNIYEFIKSIPSNINKNINSFYAKSMYNFLIEEEYNQLLNYDNYNKVIETITINHGSELKELITLLNNNTIDYNTLLKIRYENNRGTNAGGLSRQFFNNIEEQLNYYYQKKRFEASRIKLLEDIEEFKKTNKPNVKKTLILKLNLKNIIIERSKLTNEKFSEDILSEINIKNIKNIEKIPDKDNEYNGGIPLEMLIQILALSYYNKNPILYDKIFDGNKYKIIVDNIIKEFNIKNKFKKLIVEFYLQDPSEIVNKEINIKSIKIIEENYNLSNKNFLNEYNKNNNNNKEKKSNKNNDKEFINLIKKYYNGSCYIFYILHMIDFKINKDKLISKLTFDYDNINNNNKEEFKNKIISMIKNFSDKEIEDFNFAISGSKKMCPKYIINIHKTNDSNRIEYHTCFYTMDVYISNTKNKNSIINGLKANISVNNTKFTSF